jgi:hypothetical protein
MLKFMLLLCAGVALAADPPKAEAPAPQVDLHLQLRLANTERQIAELQAYRQTLLAQIQRACGSGFAPRQDPQSSEWQCQPLPPASPSR